MRRLAIAIVLLAVVIAVLAFVISAVLDWFDRRNILKP